MNIAGLNFDIPHGDVYFIGFDSSDSLLDFDFAIVEPLTYFSNLDDKAQKEPNGRLTIRHAASSLMRKRIKHWSDQLSTLLEHGQTVFVVMSEYVEISYTANDDNANTRINSSNYGFIPGRFRFGELAGSKIVSTNNEEPLASFLNLIKDHVTYKVFIDPTDGLRPFAVTMTDSRILGGVISHNRKGHIVFLPYLRLGSFWGFRSKSDSKFVTEEGEIFLSKFVDSLCEINHALRFGIELEPEPEWLESAQLNLPSHSELKSRLNLKKEKIVALVSECNDIEKNLVTANIPRRLLYETGKALEIAVHDALTRLGFITDNYDDGNVELDVVFVSPEGRCIGEVEGKDNKAINVSKFRQLYANLGDDISRDSDEEPAKGVLFGNAYRLLAPEQRQETFTKKAIVSAEKQAISLVNTVDLYRAIQYLDIHNDDNYRVKCRRAILEGRGIVHLPATPQAVEANVNASAKIPSIP